MPKVRYLGPAERISAGATTDRPGAEKYVERGSDITLDEAQIAQLEALGHQFGRTGGHKENPPEA